MTPGTTIRLECCPSPRPGVLKPEPRTYHWAAALAVHEQDRSAAQLKRRVGGCSGPARASGRLKHGSRAPSSPSPSCGVAVLTTWFGGLRHAPSQRGLLNGSSWCGEDHRRELPRRPRMGSPTLRYTTLECESPGRNWYPKALPLFCQGGRRARLESNVPTLQADTSRTPAVGSAHALPGLTSASPHGVARQGTPSPGSPAGCVATRGPCPWRALVGTLLWRACRIVPPAACTMTLACKVAGAARPLRAPGDYPRGHPAGGVPSRPSAAAGQVRTALATPLVAAEGPLERSCYSHPRLSGGRNPGQHLDQHITIYRRARTGRAMRQGSGGTGTGNHNHGIAASVLLVDCL